MSKNIFDIEGDTIYIKRPEWNFIATATVRDDYLEEIQSVTWGLNNERYLFNSKLGYLHTYIMAKWYGEEQCKEMKDKDYVIDHMDNISSNCCINNLCFLSNAYNKAKGLTFDQDNKDKEYIALTMFKDFSTELYQITIMFNYPATLKLVGFDYPSVIELAYLLYEGDYRQVLLDAEKILLDYKEDYTFSPEKLRMIDYHIEGSVGKAVPPEVYERYISGNHGHGVCYFQRIGQLRDWNKDKNEKFFYVRDTGQKTGYQIELEM
ncbi:MAG: HNH endonuclease [Lachnospiraceae bacterium]|nr:HNH endonuclease [Lachnospiraceae bacterium]